MRPVTSPRSALLACVVALTILAQLPRATRAAEPLAAAFDWSMPDRFGVDARTMGSGAPASDQVIDYLVTFPEAWETDGITGSPEVNPPVWRVDLDASASRGPIVRYAWSVEGEAIGEAATPTFSHHFPAEGSYAVTLTVHDAAGSSTSTTAEVVVQDWLVVGIGDSYASGEGNPEPVSEAWMSALVAAQAALQAAQRDLAKALEDLRQAQIELELTYAEVKPALHFIRRIPCTGSSWQHGAHRASCDRLTSSPHRAGVARRRRRGGR
jgi:hypothetical protein